MGYIFQTLVFYDSILSSHGPVNFRIITVFVVCEYEKISGLSCEIIIAGGTTRVDSISDKRTIALCSYSHLNFVEDFGSVAPVLTNE